LVVSLLTLSVPPVEGWPTHDELLALAQHARVTLDRRALCIVHHHIDDVPWSQDEALQLFLTLMRLAFATTSVEGEEEGVLVFARAALAASGNAWASGYVEAMKSRVYFASGERIAARTHFEAAVDHILSVDPDTICPDAWLGLAEASIPFDVDFAGDAVRKSESTRAASHDPAVTRSHRMVIRGRLAEALGQRADAETHYRMAWDVARADGDVRTGIVIGVQLGLLTRDGSAWSYVREHSRLCHPSWWPIRALAAEDMRRAFAMTPAQRDVLARIRRGASNRAIAAETGRSVSRVRDIVAELFDLFGVQPRTRAALVTTAHRYEPINESA
jgi:DNA-binding CsgD family transcriptional regulator